MAQELEDAARGLERDSFVRVIRTQSLNISVSLPPDDSDAQQQPRRPPGRGACCQGPFFGAKTVAGPNSTQEDSFIIVPNYIGVSSDPDEQLCSPACEFQAVQQQRQQQQQWPSPGEGSTREFQEELHLFAIFDGHGGRVVSDYCASYMHVFLRKELSAVPSGRLHRAPSQALQEALLRSFLQVDQAVQQQQQQQPSPGEGSTALVVLLGTHHVWTAHCGELPAAAQALLLAATCCRARPRAAAAAAARLEPGSSPLPPPPPAQATREPCCAAPASPCA
jgi:hypothetical protein